MTLDEIRAKLAERKKTPIEHDGLTLIVLEPSLVQAAALSAAGSVTMAYESLMVAELLTTEAGEIVFPTAQDVVALGISKTVLIAKVKSAVAGFASYGAPEPEPVNDSTAVTVEVPPPAE